MLIYLLPQPGLSCLKDDRPFLSEENHSDHCMSPEEGTIFSTITILSSMVFASKTRSQVSPSVLIWAFQHLSQIDNTASFEPDACRLRATMSLSNGYYAASRMYKGFDSLPDVVVIK